MMRFNSMYMLLVRLLLLYNGILSNHLVYAKESNAPGIRDNPNASPSSADFRTIQRSLHRFHSNAQAPLEPPIHPPIHQPLQNQRSSRSVDPNAKEFIRQSLMLARLANGIALQEGVTKNQMDVETVVGELLNLGEHGVKGVVGTGWKKLANLAAKTRSASLEMTRQDDDSVKLEDVILAWEKMRKSSLLVKKVDLSSVFDKLKTFELKFNTTILDPLLVPPTRIAGQLQLIRTFALSDSNHQTAVTEYKLLIEFIKKMKRGFKLAAELRATLIPIPEVVNISAISSAKRFLQLTDIRRASDPKIDTSNKGSYVADVNRRISSLKLLNDLLSPVHPMVKILLDISHSRQYPHKIKRSVTSGFSQGAVGINQLKAEIREPWFLRIAANDGSADKLQEALRPIFGGGNKINILEANLSAILTPEVVTSLNFMSAVFDQVSKLSSNLQNPAGVIEEYIACHDRETSLGSHNYDSIKDDIIEIDNFYKHYSTFYNSDIVNKDFGWYIKEMDDFLSFIEMSKSEDVIPEKVSKVHDRVKTSQEIERFQSSSKKVDDARGGVDEDKITAIKHILKKTTNQFVFDSSFITEEMKVYECMKQLGDKSKQVSQAIETTRVIEKLSSEPESLHVTNMETSTTALATYAKDLDSLHKIRYAMEDEMIKADVDLKVSTATSATIGHSVQYLDAASRLADISPSISQLHIIEPIVDKKIDEMTDLTKRSEVLNNWGSYGKDVKKLQSSVKSLDPLMSKLGQAKVKTLEDYGKVFEGLKPIANVKFDAAKRSEALEALFFGTGNNKSDPEMVKAKKTLDDISNLELEFSKYSSSLPSAPAAFKELSDLLTGFLGGAGGANGDTTWLTILLSVGGGAIAAFLIAGLVVFLSWKYEWFCFKKEPPPDYTRGGGVPDPDDTRECVSREYMHFHNAGDKFPTALQAYDSHFYILKILRIEENKLVMPMFTELDLRKCRDPNIKLFRRNEIPVVKYHGNFIKRRKGFKYLALQGPLSKSATHDDTVADFLEVIVGGDMRQVAMLCRFEEPGPNGQMQEACARYFNDIGEKDFVSGAWTVRTTEQHYLLDLKGSECEEDVMYRKLKIIHKQAKYPPVEIEHYQYLNWDEGSFPAHGHEGCFKISQRLRCTSGPAVAVHCSNGTGRTMTFIGMEYIAHHIEVDIHISFAQAAIKLAAHRFNAIESIRQLYWMRIGVVYYLGQWHGIGQPYSLHMDEFDRLNGKLGEHPEIPKEHGGLKF